MLDNPRSDRIKKVRALGGRSARKRSGLILVEGPQSVREVIRFRPGHVADVYASEDFVDRHRGLYDDICEGVPSVHLVTGEVSRTISAESQGITAVCLESAIGGSDQTFEAVLAAMGPGDFIAVLPETQDPGNLGTIIRSADAMGAAAVFLGKGTCEASNPKVIRSSAGSVFHLPLFTGDYMDAVASLRKFDINILGTALNAQSADLVAMLEGAASDQRGDRTLADMRNAWVFGNEARGLSEEQQATCDKLVQIPMRGASESLNAAAAASICMFASSVAKQRELEGKE